MEHAIAKKLNEFFTSFVFQDYTKGQLLIRAGQAPESIFFLEKGIVRQYALSKQGTEMTVNLFKPLSFFPMMSVFNTIPNTYYFDVVTDKARVRLAPQEKVVTFLHEHPEILFDLLCRVYVGMAGVLIHMQALLSGDAYSKLVSALLIAAKRFGLSNDTGTKIELKFTEKELAAQAGIQRETVSRLLQQLIKKGFIVRDRERLVITDLAKLGEELN